MSSYLLPVQVEQKKGEVTPFLEVVLENGKLLLHSSKVNYSFGALHDLFFRTFHALKMQERKIDQTLILGLGAGSVVNLLREDFSQAGPVLGVEKDGVVLDLAKKYFHIDQTRDLNIIHQDAYDFIAGCKTKFDLIVIDLFVEDSTPAQFAEDDFLKAIQNRLNEGGLVCYNRIVNSSEEMNKSSRLIEAFNRLIGPSFVLQYEMGNCLNWMVVYDGGTAKNTKEIPVFKPGDFSSLTSNAGRY
jgi:spermidine synthase